MKLRVLAPAIVVASFALIAGLLSVFHGPLAVSAAPGTGSITGQVVWNVSGPVPYGLAVPGAAGQSGTGQAAPGETSPAPDQSTPDASPDATPNAVPDIAAPGVAGGFPAPGMPIRPVPTPRLIPAGAVLVAVQGTNLSARTDDQGRFRIDNVPTGQYLTVAAGPVSNVTTATAMRPNVYIQNAGDTMDLGRLYLWPSYYQYYGPVPYGAAPGATIPDTVTPGASQP